MAIKIKNWSKFQHYDKRKPIWIKLYRELLEDINWFNLDPVASKMLVNLWLIASENFGELPDIKTISFRLRMNEKDVSKSLSMLSEWLILDDSIMLAERYQVAMLEKRREDKRREYIHPSDVVVLEHKPKELTPIQKIVKGWKLLTGIPVEGEESKAWDRVHFARNAKSAKSLIDLFGFEDAVKCMEYIYYYMADKKLDCTIETVVKRSDLYREKMAGGVK